MDIAFWAARVNSSKHTSAVQSAARLNTPGNHLTMDEAASEVEVRAWFPCPFCYVEIELPLLCVHLQEEHCFDLKNAVCPICAANLGKDALSHFTLQHAHSIKRRKNSQKSGFWSSTTADVVRDFRDLSSFFIGGNNNSITTKGKANDEPSPDPLLSTFICAVPLNLPKENQKDSSPSLAERDDAESKQYGSKEAAKGHNCEEKKQRAEFMQELLLSTIFQG